MGAGQSPDWGLWKKPSEAPRFLFLMVILSPNIAFFYILYVIQKVYIYETRMPQQKPN
jgi:hypothetical protein